MFIKRMSIFALILSLIFCMSACSNKTEISDQTQLTRDEMLVEYYPYKQSVFKQLENKIPNFNKLEETTFEVIDDTKKEWKVILKMDKKIFNIPQTQFIIITAQKTTITYNNYEEISSEIIGQKIAQSEVTTLLNSDIFFKDEVFSDSTSYVYTVDGILNPTEEDFKNPNNKFYLHIHINGENTREQTSCTDLYFENLNKEVSKILNTGEFSNKQNITTIVYVAGCGELKYRRTNGQDFIKVTRTADGNDKIKLIEESQKPIGPDLTNMPEEEKEKFLNEREEDFQSGKIKSEENIKNAQNLN